MASSRGRGFQTDSANAQALRRPGEAGLIQRLEKLGSLQSKNIKSEMTEVFEKMVKMDFNSETDINPLTDRIKEMCQSADDMEKCIEGIFAFAVKGKWNAHVAAIFCNAVGEIQIDEIKFRTQLLRKLQAIYKDRVKQYSELDVFLMNVTFFCEIYHHSFIAGECLKVLSKPVTDYFGMLVDGASLKEVEVFVEQFPKCYFSLKENDQAGLETLICKLRKQVVWNRSGVVVTAMLLEVFEQSLTEFKPLSESAKSLYESLAKPILRICE